MLLTQRQRDECTTTVYFGYDYSKNDCRDRDLKFTKDHSSSCTDVQLVFPEKQKSSKKLGMGQSDEDEEDEDEEEEEEDEAEEKEEMTW